jgi:hypothetical protein
VFDPFNETKEPTMKRRAAAIGMIMLVAMINLGADKEDQTNPSFWMQKKLEYSENILAGLVKKDYEQVSKNARSMNALGQVEKWARGNIPQYRAQLHVFQDANEQLIRMSDQQNLDGAALAYVQLSLSCVNCHKVVRDIQNPPKAPGK